MKQYLRTRVSIKWFCARRFSVPCVGRARAGNNQYHASNELERHHVTAYPPIIQAYTATVVGKCYMIVTIVFCFVLVVVGHNKHVFRCDTCVYQRESSLAWNDTSEPLSWTVLFLLSRQEHGSLNQTPKNENQFFFLKINVEAMCL